MSVKARVTEDGEKIIVSQVSEPPILKEPLEMEAGSVRAKAKGLSDTVLIKILRKCTERIGDSEEVPEVLSELEDIIRGQGVGIFQLPSLNLKDRNFLKDKNMYPFC